MKSELVTSLFLFAGIAFVAGGIYRDDRLWKDYQRIRPGMSASEAEAIMGSPSWRGHCDSRHLSPSFPNCRSELGYRSWFAPLKPLYWVVQLDGTGHVVSSDYIASP